MYIILNSIFSKLGICALSFAEDWVLTQERLNWLVLSLQSYFKYDTLPLPLCSISHSVQPGGNIEKNYSENEPQEERNTEKSSTCLLTHISLLQKLIELLIKFQKGFLPSQGENCHIPEPNLIHNSGGSWNDHLKKWFKKILKKLLNPESGIYLIAWEPEKDSHINQFRILFGEEKSMEMLKETAHGIYESVILTFQRIDSWEQSLLFPY